MQGIKEYRGKTRWSLLPFEALEPVVRILEYGAKTKYASNNWKHVKDKATYVDAIVRHWTKYVNGEELDGESQESHIAAIVCNALFLIYDRQQHKDESFEEYLTNLLEYTDYVKEIPEEKRKDWDITHVDTN